MPAIGIDLGTTYSAAAIVDDAPSLAMLASDGASIAKLTARVIPNAAGEFTTPSVVYFDVEQPVVGAAAKLAATIAPADCIDLVKRHMGDPSWRFVTSAGTTYTAEQVSALILRRLMVDAQAALGEPCHEAVITVPAYFDDVRRRATANAGVIAGFDVLRILNEPTAAALAFGHRSSTVGDRTLLVYDLGGGTFDVTVVRLAGDEFHVLATAGDRNLGGFDFDNVLMLHVDEQVKAAGGPSSLDGEHAEAVLRDRCEQAKRALSTLPDVVVTVDGPHANRPYHVPVTRALFEQLAVPLLRSTEEITRDVLGEASIARKDLTAALLVGGSTRMPMVGDMLSRVAGVRVDRSVHPDQAVALGAAICAAELAAARRGGGEKRRRPNLVHDVTAHSLGVIARSGETGSEINSVVIRRNTPIPARGSRRFHTLAENQAEILVVVTEGDDEDPAYVTVVGSARIPVPRSSGTIERIVEVVLGYTEEGLIEVSVVDAGETSDDPGSSLEPAEGATLQALGHFTIDRQSAVDAGEVARMREALNALHVE